MADEQLDPAVNTDPQVDQSAQNPGEGQSDVSPASQEDTASKYNALLAQFEREKERNQLLERSLQLQERFVQQQPQQPTPQPTTKESWDTPEMEVLDKALDPLLQKRFRTQMEPLSNQYNQVLEDNDALRFEMFLQRNNPEVFDDEDLYARTMQQVQAIRDAGRTRGMNVSRVDAFVFNEGLTGTKAKVAQRKTKRTTVAATETRRVAEVAAANAMSGDGAPRVQTNAGINTIREKASRGERLSQEERAKLRDFVSNVEL